MRIPSNHCPRILGRYSLDVAVKVGREVEALLTNGPAGGGGATRTVKETVAVESTLVPRSLVSASITIDEVDRGGPRNSDSLLRWNPDQGEGVWHATEETELPG